MSKKNRERLCSKQAIAEVLGGFRVEPKRTGRRMADPFLFMLTLMIAVILSLFPAGAPKAETIPSTWNGGTGDWSMPEKWTPAGVPSNYINFSTASEYGWIL